MEWIEHVLNNPIRTEGAGASLCPYKRAHTSLGIYCRDRQVPTGRYGLIKGEGEMIFEYYPDTDMLYIKLVEGISTESEEVAQGIVLDFDEHNRVIGIEIEDASKFVDLSRLELKALPLVNLVLTERVPVGA
jgi:uncharacterized protein YuzE